MNADSLAHCYQWLERAVFGRLLEDCRFHFLPAMLHSRRVLILGEGDGRFLARFLAQNTAASVEVVELSRKMIAVAESRFSHHDRHRVQFIPGNTADWTPHSQYDLVVTHFFLDCLTQSECDALVSRIASSAAIDATWIVSEFHVPERRWARLHARGWIAVMYAFFRWATGLKVRQIPNYESALHTHGFVCVEQKTWRWGLVRSQRFIKQ